MNDSQAETPQAADTSSFLSARLLSLDAYRGLIMISLAFGGFGLAKTAGNMLVDQPGNPLWTFLQNQFTHVQWTGCTYWDLIQPSFMFMVGLSLPYSYSKRKQRGDGFFAMLGHAVFRSIFLIALGIFLTSNGSTNTNWSLMNVLCQIGLGYTFLFLLWNRSVLIQSCVAILILGLTWFLYERSPQPELQAGQAYPELGITKEWSEKHLEGIPAAWQKNANFGHAADRWLLNLPNPYLPRKTEFKYNNGGYQTFNFVPSIVTMLFGLMCGELLRSNPTRRKVIQSLLAAGLLGLLWGYALDQTGVCPLVKRLWTPSWVLFSGGCCFLLLLGFYLLFDVLKLTWLALPLTIVGLNSIAMYCMGMLLKPWVAKTIRTHAGPEIFEIIGSAWQPMVQSVATGMVFWIVCLYLYRRRVFIRI